MNISEEASLIRQLEEARAVINQRNGILQTRWFSFCERSLRTVPLCICESVLIASRSMMTD